MLTVGQRGQGTSEVIVLEDAIGVHRLAASFLISSLSGAKWMKTEVLALFMALTEEAR